MNERELMLTSILGCERLKLYTEPRRLTPQQEEVLAHMQIRRKQGEPLQYILGYTRFLEFDLKVDAHVLIPRPETELLVEALMKATGKFIDHPLHILDLGTGSGNIAISLARYLPNSTVEAVDISIAALLLARENAAQHQVADRIYVKQCSFAEFFNRVFADHEKFDIIVSNPPYIAAGQMEFLPPEVRQEPPWALCGGEDGLKYLRLIIENAPACLKTNGILALEFGDGQRPALENIFGQTGHYGSMEFGKDYTQSDRFVLAGLSPG